MESNELKRQLQAELDALKIEGEGTVTPEALVEFASDPKTAWYKKFPWSDAEAAHAHRLQLARQYIAVYITVIDNGAGNLKPARAYVSTRQPGSGNGYVETKDVLSDPARRLELIRSILTRMASLASSYPLVELDGVVRAIKRAQAALPAAPARPPVADKRARVSLDA